MAIAGETNRQRYVKLLAQLKSERSTWDKSWKSIIDYITPLRGAIGQDPVSLVNRGDRGQPYVLDATATKDLETMASGLMTGITSPARPWFQLATPDPDLNKWLPARIWLEDSAERMHDLFRRSNLYTALPEKYMDLGSIGTSATGFYEDDQDVFRFHPYPVGSWFLASNERLEVDTFVREFALTVRQVVDRFGIDNVSTTLRSKYNTGKFEQWVSVVQVVSPNADYDPNRLHPKFKRWSSCFFEAATNEQRTLRESGFDQFPILAPRWRVEGENVYGQSPGRNILPDVKGLQVMERRMAQAIEKQVDPAVMAPSDLASGELDTRPGAVNYYSRNAPAGSQPVLPVYQVNVQLQALESKIQQKQQAIHRGLYTDLFLMLTLDTRAQPPTAEEIRARQEEKLLVLGPVLERLNDELLDPLINRAFAIMVKRGLLSPPPKELQGKPLNVQYVSVMAQAQKLVGLSAQERLIGHVGMLAQFNPEALDKIDMDREIDDYADKVGASAHLLRSADQVAALRKSRAQAQAAQQSMATASVGAKAAKDLSGAKLGADPGDNALAQIASRAQPVFGS